MQERAVAMVYEDELATLRTQLTTAHRERDEAREKVAAWMIAHSFATGHGDTIDDLLAELSGHIKSERDELKARIETLRIALEMIITMEPRSQSYGGDVRRCAFRALTSPPTPSRSDG
jgi:aminopeptidase N